jgi:hypothetical protein
MGGFFNQINQNQMERIENRVDIIYVKQEHARRSYFIIEEYMRWTGQSFQHDLNKRIVFESEKSLDYEPYRRFDDIVDLLKREGVKMITTKKNILHPFRPYKKKWVFLKTN